MKPAELSYSRPATLAAALESLAEAGEHGRVISGGQSLGPMLNLRLAQPKRLIDISRIADLCSAAEEGDVLAIGACVTHARIEDGEIPETTGGLMTHVARGIAYRAVRNRGTIGGSLAHADPAADWLTTMIALDASVRIAGLQGTREVKVSDFVVGALDTTIAAGEIVTHVLVPHCSKEARWGHAKYAKKLGDFAQSLGIAVIDPARKLTRVVLGRRSEPPVIMTETSKLLGSGHAPGGLEAAIAGDLKRASVETGDWSMHRAIVTRAVQGLAR